MTVRKKLKEVKNEMQSVGIEFSEIDFIEYSVDEFNDIPDYILEKEVDYIQTFKDCTTYLEIICKCNVREGEDK